MAAVKSITPCCMSKFYIKLLLNLQTSKTLKNHMNFSHLAKIKLVTVIYGANTKVVNALLDYGLDTTLTTSKLAKILKLKES